jgi:hypothetical protein
VECYQKTREFLWFESTAVLVSGGVSKADRFSQPIGLCGRLKGGAKTALHRLAEPDPVSLASN